MSETIINNKEVDKTPQDTVEIVSSKPLKHMRTIDEIHNYIKRDIDTKKQMKGFLVYLVCFIFIIPIILYKYQFYTILEAYLPNVDLVANVLSWYGGPNDMWKELYLPLPNHWYNYISQNIINYIALLGVTYIIARETYKTKSIIKGWCIALVMILMTYLLPSHFITIFMDKFNSLTNTHTPNIVIAIIGIFISALVIFSESLVILHTRSYLERFGKNIISLPDWF